VQGTRFKSRFWTCGIVARTIHEPLLNMTVREAMTFFKDVTRYPTVFGYWTRLVWATFDLVNLRLRCLGAKHSGETRGAPVEAYGRQNTIYF